MSADQATYLDSSAIVKLVREEPESAALSRFLRRRGLLVSSALALTEVGRALLPFGVGAVRHGTDVLAGIELVRVSDRVLRAAAALHPVQLRSLDAVHLATALDLSTDLAHVITYDARMAAAAKDMGLEVLAPT